MTKNNVLNLSGSPFEIGFKHGESARNQVHNSLQTYEKMFKEYASVSWKDAIEKAQLHLGEIEKFNLNYVEEMEGLAKGAGVTFNDILTLNSRSEIALISSPDGCTSFSLTKPKTSKTWLAQNWDWKGAQLDSLIQIQIEQEKLPTIHMVTEAGIIGKIGFNSSGLGVCLNALLTSVWEPKVPIHFGLRAILESESIEEALSKTANGQMASAAHFLIASNSEELVSLEVSPVYNALKTTDTGMLVHTNHICDQAMKKEVNEAPLPDSFNRFTTIKNELEQLTGENIVKKDLFRILSNHDNYPNSICRHDSPIQSKREKMETVFSIVMNLSDNKFEWMSGKPCAQKL